MNTRRGPTGAPFRRCNRNSGKMNHFTIVSGTEKREIMMQTKSSVLCSFLLAFCLVPCVSGAGEGPGTFAFLQGKRIGVLEGSMNGEAIRKKVPEFTMLYFMTANDLVTALKSGDVEAIVSDAPALAVLAQGDRSLRLIRDLLQDDNYAFATSKKATELNERISAILRELAQDGTLKRLHAKWVTGPEEGRTLPGITPGGERVLRFGVAEMGRPFVYQNKEGKLIGYDIELAMILAQKLGMTLHLQEMLFAHLIQSIANGSVDVIGASITVTPERSEEVLFTAPYFRGGAAVMVRAQ